MTGLSWGLRKIKEARYDPSAVPKLHRRLLWLPLGFTGCQSVLAASLSRSEGFQLSHG